MNLAQTIDFATSAHGDQTYGPDHPYVCHLAAVQAVLERFVPASEPSLELLVHAAWLHDVIEDTPVSVEQVRERFGDDIARIVDAVSDEEGINRRERKSKTYPKIRRAGRVAVILKLADRIANIEAGLATGTPQVQMYRKEQWGFYGALYDLDAGSVQQSMWQHIAGLLSRGIHQPRVEA